VQSGEKTNLINAVRAQVNKALQFARACKLAPG